MPIELYYAPYSPPSRAVMLTAKALGVEVDLKLVNLMQGEHKTEEFTAINPECSVPVIVDEDFTLSESRAISKYLVKNYGDGSSLYPEDPKEQAMVDKYLYFDACTLIPRLMKALMPVFMKGEPISEENMENLKGGIAYLNAFLDGKEFIAGETITIADQALVSTMGNISVVFNDDLSDFPNVKDWMDRCAEQMEGFEEVNLQGLEAFRQLYKSKCPSEE